MAELNFSTGVREYTINDVCTVHFNPTDSYFVERLYNTFEALDRKQEKFRTQIDGMTDNREIFKVSRAMDEEMRADVNAVFGRDVCGELFPDMNVYAMGDGLPAWANFLLTVIDEVNGSAEAEQKRTSARVDKYLAKYRKYQK